jgi:hypothetical protein
MKHIAIIFSLILLSASVFAQTQNNARAGNPAKDKIMPYQFGTAETSNGTYTLNFDAPMTMEYSVMLTPFSASASLYIYEKSQNRFIVKTSDGSDIEFDFIVFVKKTPPAPQQ